MTGSQKLCLFYFVALMIAASINYIPGLTDDKGLAFGIFALDLYDDALHVASALWALAAGLISTRAALKAAGFGDIEYIDLRCPETLAPLERPTQPARLLAAAWLDGIRLIDNIEIPALSA